MPYQQVPISRAAQAALLKWVNTFPLDRRVDRLEDLADGHVLAQMLHDLDAEYDPAELEQNAGSSSWLTNKRNVQSVFKSFTKYVIHKDSSGVIDFLPRTVDFRAISDNLNADSLAQIVALFAAAAMLGGHNTEYIPIMRDTLSTSEQAEIMAILQQKDEQRQRLAESSGAGLDGIPFNDDDAAAAAADPGLVAEAQLATLAADYDRLSKRLADSNTRMEHLQISYEQMKDELERKDRELDLERAKYGASESQLTRDLQDKLREQDELISNQEAQLEDDRLTKQRLTTENAQLSKKAVLVEELQDQVQEMRHANDELSKKANTIDRYKQKLEAQRGMETDLQNALYELAQNKEGLKELEALQQRTTQQQATIERFRGMVSGLEQQIEENRIQKTAIEGDMYTAHLQLDGLREQNMNNEARIAELEQQLLSGGHGSGGGADADGSGGFSPDGTRLALNLEEELQHTTDPATAQYKLEISRLRAENNVLRNKVEMGSENDRLRADLEMAKTKEEAARRKYSEIFENHALLETQMTALLGGGSGMTAAAMGETQRRLQETTAELEHYKATSRDVGAQLADRTRELAKLRAEMDAGAKGASVEEALAELRATDAFVADSLTRELAELRIDYRSAQVDKEHLQQQLIEALVSKDELRQTMDRETREDTQMRLLQPPGLGFIVPPISPMPPGLSTEEQLNKSTEKVDKLRTAMKQLKKQYDLVMADQVDMQRKLKATEAKAKEATAALMRSSASGSGSGAGASSGGSAKDSPEQRMIRNLQRENAMITTAWYDLTSRLQSNHVVLQRRQDMPKSWLNKQRQMVNATPRK